MANELREKVIIELDVEANLGGEVFLTHPDLSGRLLLRSSSPRLAEVQLGSLAVPMPSEEAQEKFETTQELFTTLRELSAMGPEIFRQLFGKTPSEEQK